MLKQFFVREEKINKLVALRPCSKLISHPTAILWPNLDSSDNFTQGWAVNLMNKAEISLNIGHGHDGLLTMRLNTSFCQVHYVILKKINQK